MNLSAQKHQPNKTQELKLRGQYANGRVAIIDASDSDLVNKYEKWWCTKTGYVYAQVGRNNIYLARLIMNPPDGLQVDHINRNKLDNRKSNLRICKPYENSANVGIRNVNTSGYKGVGWCKKNRNWKAEITYKKKYQFIGSFKTAKEAAIAYDSLARKYFGEFAYLNFPRINRPPYQKPATNDQIHLKLLQMKKASGVKPKEMPFKYYNGRIWQLRRKGFNIVNKDNTFYLIEGKPVQFALI